MKRSNFLYDMIKAIYFSDKEKLYKAFNIVLNKKDKPLKQYSQIVREVIKPLSYKDRKVKDISYIGSRVLARAVYEKLTKRNYDKKIEECGGLYKYGLGFNINKVKKLKNQRNLTELQISKKLASCK